MLKLLKLEWKKFRKNSVIRMLFVIFLIIFPAIMLVFLDENVVPSNPLLDPADIFRYPGIWMWLGYIGNWIVFFVLGFMVVYMVSIEVTYKTMRQNVITGLSRTEFFLSKLSVVVVFALVATAYYAILGVLMGLLSDQEVTFALIFNNEWAIARFFLMCLGYLSFALFIGFAIKNSGLAVLTYLAYGIIIENLVRWFGHKKVVPEGDSYNYYPLNAMEDLQPIPMPNEMLSKAIDFLPYSHAAILSVVYMTVFIVLTYVIFQKRDL